MEVLFLYWCINFTILWCCKVTYYIQSLRMHKPFHGEKEVVEQLYKFKNEIKIFGDKYAKLY